MTNFTAELIKPVAPATWTPLVSAAVGHNPAYRFHEYTGMVVAGSASPLNDVTVTLRKATSSGGANATTVKAKTGVNGFAAASLNVTELGEFSPGVPFTHVQAVGSDQASPNTVVTSAMLGKPAFSNF